MSKDEQEAQSKKYGNEVIILLPLESGNVAVFNSARELCGIIIQVMNYDSDIPMPEPTDIETIKDLWFPPKTQTSTDVLKKAGLL